MQYYLPRAMMSFDPSLLPWKIGVKKSAIYWTAEAAACLFQPIVKAWSFLHSCYSSLIKAYSWVILPSYYLATHFSQSGTGVVGSQVQSTRRTDQTKGCNISWLYYLKSHLSVEFQSWLQAYLRTNVIVPVPSAQTALAPTLTPGTFTKSIGHLGMYPMVIRLQIGQSWLQLDRCHTSIASHCLG